MVRRPNRAFEQTRRSSAQDRGAGGKLWWRWLSAVSVLVLVFGAALILAPGLMQRLFNLLFFNSAAGKSAFLPAAGYLRFAFATLGAVMFGWAVCMLVVLTLRRGTRDAWLAVVISLVAWFAPDTIYSLASGFWQNAILNTLIAILFAVPLVAIHRESRRSQLVRGAFDGERAGRSSS